MSISGSPMDASSAQIVRIASLRVGDMTVETSMSPSASAPAR